MNYTNIPEEARRHGYDAGAEEQEWSDIYEQVEEILSQMTPQERECVEARYGFGGQTTKELAQERGVTLQWITKCSRRAIRQARERVEAVA